MEIVFESLNMCLVAIFDHALSKLDFCCGALTRSITVIALCETLRISHSMLFFV